LSCDAEHGDTRAVTVEQAVDEVQIAGSTAPRADGKLICQMSLGAGCECGDFFVAHVNPLDLPLPSDGVSQTIEAVADDAIDPLDANGCERFGELVRYGLGHVFSLDQLFIGSPPIERVSRFAAAAPGFRSDKSKPPTDRQATHVVVGPAIRRRLTGRLIIN